MTPDKHEPVTSLYSGEQGTTPTPVDVEETTPAPTPIAEMPVIPEKKRFTKNQKIIATIAGIAIATSLLAFANSCNNKNLDQNRPVATAPIGPSEIPTKEAQTPIGTPETLPTAKSLEMDASLLSNPELLATTFINDLSTEWFNAGASLENAQAAFDLGSISIYAKKIASEYDKIFIEALLIKGWESNPQLVEWVRRVTEGHYNNLMVYYATSSVISEDPANEVPYMRGSKLDKIDSFNYPNNKSVIISTTEHDYDNADKNRVEDISNGFKVDSDSIVHPARTFTIINNKIKLSNIIFG